MTGTLRVHVCVCQSVSVCGEVCVSVVGRWVSGCQLGSFLLRFSPCNVHLILFMLTIAGTNTHENTGQEKETEIMRMRQRNADCITNSFPQVSPP